MKKNEMTNPLFEAGLEVQNSFKNLKWPFCFIGGLAVIRWGEIRMTQDIDLCLSCGFGNEEKFIDTLLTEYKSRITGAKQFAIKNRVLLLFASNNVAVDISLSGLPFENEMINRATQFKFQPSCSLKTCSAEDLVVLKAFANRSKDWGDIESILKRQGNRVDKNHILRHLTPLCELKGALEIINRLEKLLDLIE